MYSTLISASDLLPLLGEPDWCIVDVRHRLDDPAFGERAYRESHIPGAHFLHLDRDLSGPVNGKSGKHPLPDPVVFADKLGSIGIGVDTQVVVYDDADMVPAARLWWMLRWLGHEAVAVLDGGLAAWLAVGGPMTGEMPASVQAHLPLKPSRVGTVDADFVLRHLESPEMSLVDARGADRFRGLDVPAGQVAGHIPGALNRPSVDNFEVSGGCFKPVAQLRQEFTTLLGSTSPGRVVQQCNSGVSACVNLLAMEVAGLSGSRLYPGSWSQWSSDPDRPVAT